ncbi:MAG: hypothetical protein G5Z43_001036 [Caldisphaeraceae archaeon]|nr:hypothetical protein [Caldisphaeraceae archaeon]
MSELESRKGLPGYSRVVNALTVASLLMQSTTVLDRMAYALTSEQAIRAISDSMRIVSSGLENELIKHEKKESRDGSKTYDILIVTPSKTKESYEIYGTLPSEEEVSKVVEELSSDIRIARKIGAIALASYAKVLQERISNIEKGE